MMSISLPKILFIKGVFKRDCVSGDFVEKKVMDELNDNLSLDVERISVTREMNINTKIEMYCNKLPCIFETLEKWPKRTNLVCWHCSLPFDTIPVLFLKSSNQLYQKISRMAIL